MRREGLIKISEMRFWLFGNLKEKRNRMLSNSLCPFNWTLRLRIRLIILTHLRFNKIAYRLIRHKIMIQ